MSNTYIKHHGVKGQQWGVRRFQNEDGTRTAAGLKQEKAERKAEAKVAKAQRKADKKAAKEEKNRQGWEKASKIKTSSILAGAFGSTVVAAIGTAVTLKGTLKGNQAMQLIGGLTVLAGLAGVQASAGVADLRNKAREQVKKGK